MNNTFRAFQNRNYTLFFTGQSVSQIGTWMQKTSVSWVIYTMTGSSLMLGLSIFASQFPSFLFSLYGGVVADRYNRHKILLITQLASMLQAIVLAVLTLLNHYVVWEILTLSVFLGIINAFDVPARQPLVHQLVTNKEDLPNALALNSSMVNLAKLIGPALSGIVLEIFGAGICFLSNALSFVAVIISLLLMKLPAQHFPPVKKKITTELSESMLYLKNSKTIRIAILMLSLLSLFVLSYETILPIFAKEIFKGDAATYGYIRSFIGLGAIGGTFLLASLKSGTDLKIVLLINSIILGIGLIFFSHISYFPFAMVFAVLIGFGAMSQTTILLTIVQIETEELMRGRIMGFIAMAFFGMLPIGSLFIGSISKQIGAPNTIFCQGILTLIIVASFSGFLRKGTLV
ncbi:MAG TPA: MFS transporter [Cytophagaceae bacterium]|jgi:MFS family permease|nr:MFS transporter [Cytophagaceae bacterium]